MKFSQVAKPWKGDAKIDQNDLRGKENLFKQPKDSNKKTRMKDNMEDIVDIMLSEILNQTWKSNVS